jgi:hypothetical protein
MSFSEYENERIFIFGILKKLLQIMEKKNGAHFFSENYLLSVEIFKKMRVEDK